MGGGLTRRQEQKPGRTSHCASAASAGRRVASSALSELARTVYMAGTSPAERAMLFADGGGGRGPDGEAATECGGGGGGGNWAGMIGEGGRARWGCERNTGRKGRNKAERPGRPETASSTLL
jgi:hypothetical protein